MAERVDREMEELGLRQDGDVLVPSSADVEPTRTGRRENRFGDTIAKYTSGPLQEAWARAMDAGQIDVDPDDPALVTALKRANDYFGDMAMAGLSVGEAGAKAVAASVGEVFGDVGGQGRSGEERLTRDLMAAPEAFAAAGVGRGVNLLDDVLEMAPKAFSAAATQGARGLERLNDAAVESYQTGTIGSNFGNVGKTDAPFDVDRGDGVKLPPPENAQRTQIAGTFPTYEKAEALLSSTDSEGRTLDFGAGLGRSQELGFDTYEPYPREGFNPTFSSAGDIPDNSYEKITNLNVLNVVPKDARDEIVTDIGRVLKPGGKAVITTRGRDVMSATGQPGPESMSVITGRGTYQKGFTPKELREYVQSTLGDDFEVENVRLGQAGVVAKKRGPEVAQSDEGVRVFHASPQEIEGDFRVSDRDVGVHFAENPDLAINASVKSSMERPDQADTVRAQEFVINASPEQIADISANTNRFDFYEILESLSAKGRIKDDLFNDIYDGLEEIEDSNPVYGSMIEEQNKYLGRRLSTDANIRALRYFNEFDAGPTWKDLEQGKTTSSVEPDYSYIVLDPAVITRPSRNAPSEAGKDTGNFARGGLALSESRKGIRTQAGMDMADNKKQLDRKKADVNGDGEVSDYEKQRAEAIQNAEMPDMSCGGIMGDPMMTGVDPVSGNPIPVGATAENVRDDIPVNISQDEYVLPAHVVKYHGLKHIMELQSEAEMGLMALQADGLIQSIGGEDEDAEEEPDGEGSEDAKVSAKGTETEEGESSPETTETPEGNEIELAGVDVSDEEFEDDETEEYKDSAYPTKSKSRMYGMMKKPKVTFIV